MRPGPAYLELGLDELRARAETALAALADCRCCPRDCGVNRLDGRWSACKTGRWALVGSHFPHFGEEDCLRGWNGSGTIFINFVTPEHVVPQVLEALVPAVESGLRLPIVYNTSAYDALESLEWMDGIVDIYMPDFKMWDPERSKTYMKAADYPEVARAAVREMHRQVGELEVRADGLARRGLIVRHLVMPGMLDETRAILEWVADELGPGTYVNLMDQYYPAGDVGPDHLPEIDRRLRPGEFRQAREIAASLGLRRLDERDPHPKLLMKMAGRRA